MYYILFLTLLGNILFQDGCRAREKTTLLFQTAFLHVVIIGVGTSGFGGFFLCFALLFVFVFVFCFLVCFCCFSLHSILF